MHKVPRQITVRMLERMGACSSGIAYFRRRFGNSVPFLPGNIYDLDSDPVHRGYSVWLLANLAPEQEMEAWRKYLADGTSYNVLGAAALCRLARQNLPQRKARKGASRG
jgi:hypothetical protein